MVKHRKRYARKGLINEYLPSKKHKDFIGILDASTNKNALGKARKIKGKKTKISKAKLVNQKRMGKYKKRGIRKTYAIYK